MKSDKWYYKVLQTFKELPFLLLDLPIPDVAYEFKSVEVKEFGFRIDGLLIPDDEASPLVLVEVQMQPDEDLYYRMGLELWIYLQQNRPPNPWLMLAIYPDRSTERTVPQLNEILSFGKIYRVYLEDIPTDVPFSLRLLRLVVVPPEVVPEQGRALIEELRRFEPQLSQQCLKLVTEIVNRRFPDLQEEALRQMLGLADLEDTRAYKEGEEKGEQIGEQKGRIQEALSLVLRLLVRRFGSLSPQTQSRIEALSLEQLETLAEDLLDFSDLTDLENWLNQ